MIPKEGQVFKVSFKAIKYTYEAVIIGRTWDGLYKVRTFNRIDFDAVNRPYSREDDEIEVEPKWFDSEETGRIITVKEQLKLF